jgi:gliding motility-associated-like protein
MRDAAHTGCMVDLDGTTETKITQPLALTATITSTNVTCNGVNDGTITISSPAGGYGTYEYSIDGGTSWQNSGSYTGLSPATTYNVLIRDAAHITDVVDLDGAANTTTIQSTAALTTTITTQNITCNGSIDGSITFSSSAGGYGTYEYSIDGGTNWQSSGSFIGLAPATTYNLQIRDAAHIACSVDLDGAVNTTITQPAVLGGTVTFTNVSGFGANDGTITISAPTGGYGTYDYSIDGGANWQSSGSFTGLANASYNVFMRDAAHTGCVADLDGGGNTTIIQPSSVLSATVATTNINCNGDLNGTITITSPAGGYGTYEYSIDGGANWQASGSFTGLAAGTNYNVKIRDAVYTADVVDLDGTTNTKITGPSALNLSGVVTEIGCGAMDTGAIDLSVSGGTSPYTYNWSNSAIDQDISNLIQATYSVTVTDFNSCTKTISFAVDINCLFRVYQGVSPNGDGKNDYWRIDKIEEYPGNTVRIFDRFNNLVYETHGYSNETNNWTGQSNHGIARGILPEDTYFYWVDLGGGKGTYSGFVVLKNH